MSDKIKVLAGLVVLALLITVPFWLNAGKSGEVPEVVIADAAKKAGNCVESKEWMAANHMALLNTWRDVVVREGKHIYVNESGEEFNMSLSSGENSCLGCHTSTAEFCDRCHDYTGVNTLYCWECHIDPSKENK